MVTKAQKISAILEGPDTLEDLFRRETNLLREGLKFTVNQHRRLVGSDAWKHFWGEVNLQDLKDAFQKQGENNCCLRYYDQDDNALDGYHLFESHGNWILYRAERGARYDETTYSTKEAAIWTLILGYAGGLGIPVDLN